MDRPFSSPCNYSCSGRVASEEALHFPGNPGRVGDTPKIEISDVPSPDHLRIILPELLLFEVFPEAREDGPGWRGLMRRRKYN